MRAITILAATLLAAPVLMPAGSAAVSSFDVDIPGFDGHFVPATVYLADDAPAPTLLWGHGWAGNRGSAAGTATFFAENGYNVVAMDFRGHGAARSTSMARVHDVDFEIKDVSAVIDWISAQPWAQLDGAGDPTLGALGGSYGGGYQLLTAAFDDRLDAIAPEITWNDLPRSLAPNGGVKSAWVDLLYGGGTAQANLDPIIHQAFAWAMATNDFPDGQLPGEPDIVTLFAQNSPSAYPDAIDIPTFLIQGAPDTLFNLNEALANARQIAATGADVRLMTHLGGHVFSSQGTIPGGFPDTGLQPPPAASPCGSVNEAILAWYDHHLKGGPDTLPDALLGADDGSCFPLTGIDFTAPAPLGDVETFAIALGDAAPVLGTRSGARVAGAQLSDTSSFLVGTWSDVALVAGEPVLRAELTVLGGEAIAYFGIERERGGVRELVNAQVTPLRLPAGDHAVELALGGLVGAIAPGDALHLTAVTWSGQHAQNSGREPSVVLVRSLEVDLPLR